MSPLSLGKNQVLSWQGSEVGIIPSLPQSTIKKSANVGHCLRARRCPTWDEDMQLLLQLVLIEFRELRAHIEKRDARDAR